MLRNDTAQKLSGKWKGFEGSPLHSFSVDGIWQQNYHRLYLNQIEEEINRPETALKPFVRPAKLCVELIQLKHFFEQKGLQAGIVTVWHKDFYGFLVPFTEKEYPDMKPVFKLV